MSEQRSLKIADKQYLKFVGNNENMPSSGLSSGSSTYSTDSVSSSDSSGLGILTRSNSLLSRSGSDISVRTGSAAYARLPLRPAPPPPPRSAPSPPPPQFPRRSSRTATPSLPSSGETSNSSSLVTVKMSRARSRKKSLVTKKLSRMRQLQNKSTSSDTLTEVKNCSLRDKEKSRTYSTGCLHHLFLSLPPPYPPPPPPDSPPFPQIPPLPSRQLLESIPLHAPPVQALQRPDYATPMPDCNNSSRYGIYHKIENHGCLCCPLLKIRVFLSFMSFALSIACCCLLAVFFMNDILNLSNVQICLNQQNDFGTILDLAQNVTANNSGKYYAINSTMKSSESRDSKPTRVSAHIYFQASRFEFPACDSNKYISHRMTLAVPKIGRLNGHSMNTEVEGDGLRLVYSGLYFVYSSITFVPGVCSSDQGVQMNSSIVRVKQGGSQVVLTESNNICLCSCNKYYHTSYTGGVFQLDRTDVIYVNITMSSMMNFKVETSYMGIVMVATTEL